MTTDKKHALILIGLSLLAFGLIVFMIVYQLGHVQQVSH